MNNKMLLILIIASFLIISNSSDACYVNEYGMEDQCELSMGCEESFTCIGDNSHWFECDECLEYGTGCCVYCDGTFLGECPSCNAPYEGYCCERCGIKDNKCPGDTECKFQGLGYFATKIAKPNSEVGVCGNYEDEIGCNMCHDCDVPELTYDGGKCWYAYGFDCGLSTGYRWSGIWDGTEKLCALCNADGTQGEIQSCEMHSYCCKSGYGEDKCESACIMDLFNDEYEGCDEKEKTETCYRNGHKATCSNCRCNNYGSCLDDDDCNTAGGYECDVSTGDCVKCDSNNVQMTENFDSGVYKCEVGGDTNLPNRCGADPQCDEITPDTGDCDINCEYDGGEECIPDGCNGICPPFCTVDDDPDCGCQDGDGCCGVNCDMSNDNNCCDGICPDEFEGDNDGDCACTNSDGCCGKYIDGTTCTVEDDNNCCDDVCVSGFDVTTDYDCGCDALNEDGCCPLVANCVEFPITDPLFDLDCTVCNYLEPTVEMITDDDCIAGNVIEYTIDITNNYNGLACEDTIFELTFECPSGWDDCDLEGSDLIIQGLKYFLTIPVGETKTVTLSVTPPVGQTEGEDYPITFTATNITEEGTFETTAEAMCTYGIMCITDGLCDAVCPPGCSNSDDPDCQPCTNNDDCCSVGCNSRNDNDCPECYDSDGRYELEKQVKRSGFCVDEYKCKGKLNRDDDLVSGGCLDDCSSYSVKEYYCSEITNRCEIEPFDCKEFNEKWCAAEGTYLNRVCTNSMDYMCYWPGSFFGGFDYDEGAFCRLVGSVWAPFRPIVVKDCTSCTYGNRCKRWPCPSDYNGGYIWACVPRMSTPDDDIWGWLGADENGDLPYLSETSGAVPASWGCEDELDNDCDTLIDCDDPDCGPYCAPTTTIECNGETCSDCWYQNVQVTLICSGGKSPCDKTYFCYDRTDSCAPDQSLQYEYLSPFTLTDGTYYVKYFSVDEEGNVETLKSQTIKVKKPKVLEPFISVLNLGSEEKDIELSLAGISPSSSTIDVEFDPNPIPAGEYHSKMTVTAYEGTKTGIYTLTIRGISDRGTPSELSRTTTYALSVV